MLLSNMQLSKGYDEIELYGVTGGRLDHFFAVMCLLRKISRCFV